MDTLLFGVTEAPNLVALDSPGRDFANGCGVIVSASHSRIDEQLRHSVLCGTCHTDGRSDRITLDETATPATTPSPHTQKAHSQLRSLVATSTPAGSTLRRREPKRAQR